MLRLGAPADEISRKLRVSGYTIRDVRCLVDAGYIAYGGDGEPRFARSVEEAEAYLSAYRRGARSVRVSTPMDVVTATVMRRTAEEARRRIEAKMTVGEVVIYVLEQLRRDGYDPEEYPPERIIPEMYQAWRELPKLRRRLRELEGMVERYEREYSPLEHARKIIRLMNESALALALLRRAGFRLSRDSAPVKLYNHLINRFASALYA
jgi:hypothetical protein